MQEMSSPVPPELSAIICYLGDFAANLVGAEVVVSSLSSILHWRLGHAVTLGPWTVGITSISELFFAVHWTSNSVVAPSVGKLIDLIGRAKVFRLY